jgi:hypothetical protein
VHHAHPEGDEVERQASYLAGQSTERQPLHREAWQSGLHPIESE